MGLQAANEGFLRAFLRHGRLPSCVAQVRNAQEVEQFRALVADVCGPQQPVEHLFADDQAGLARVGALLHPFPGFGHLAWNRQFGGAASYSLLGITHTTATQAVMDSIGNLAIAPIQPWDAVVCTSRAVRATYETVLELWEEHLRQRLGATRLPWPQLPIIPLGVDTSWIAPASAASRQSWRTRLKIPAEAFVVLWVGRFNHAAKAHPIPTYLALEQLAQRLEQPVVYLQAGWFGNEAIQQAFTAAAQRWAPSVQHLFVDGRQPELRQQIWHAPDVFCSLSDNLQETFGLTPIEAMAAGLPVVVSDWDGYRDTVRDGIDGFRVPTTMPAAGYGQGLAHRFCAQTISYDYYCAVTAQTVAVDLPATVRALEILATQPELRQQQGAAGRQRALETYGWEVVIGQYQQLLEELADRRVAARREDPMLGEAPAQPAPLRADPYRVFSSYPSRFLNADLPLKLSEAFSKAPDAIARHSRLRSLNDDPLHQFATAWRLPLADLDCILNVIEKNSPCTLEQLVAELESLLEYADFNRLTLSLVWLAKINILTV
ncbi:MAG: glycosyltransferase family 4 protein [Cyanobium sp.]